MIFNDFLYNSEPKSYKTIHSYPQMWSLLYMSEWGLGNGLVQPLGTWLDRGLLPGEALFPAAAVAVTVAVAGNALSFDIMDFSLNRAESPSN